MSFAIPYIIFSELVFLFSFPLFNKSCDFIESGNRYLINNTIQIPILTMILLFFIGCRAFIFTDFYNYYKIFEEAPTLFEGKLIRYLKDTNIERGYLIYNIIIKTIGLNFYGFQIISWLIDYIILYHFFIDNNVSPTKGFLFFVVFYGFVMEFNLFRNDKSIMLFILSIKYVKEHRVIKYSILNLLGCTFHITSILYLFLYPILIHNFKSRSYLFIIIVGYFVYLSGIPFLRNFLLFVCNFVEGRLAFVIRSYAGNNINNARTVLSIGFIERTITFILFFIVYRKKMLNESDYIYLNLFCIYFSIFLYFSELKVIVERLPILFACCYWILYPKVYKILKKEYKYVFLVVFFFYIILKCLFNYKIPNTKYENIFLPHMNYSERVHYSEMDR